MLRLQFAASQRTDQPLSVVFIDLDRFKTINDGFGHEEGDRVLRGAAMTIRDSLRGADMLARWGGEEFVVVMPNTDVVGAVAAVERLAARGLGPRPDGTAQTCSMGVAEWRGDGVADWQALVDKADQRMYRAKQRGRDQVIWNDAVVEAISAT